MSKMFALVLAENYLFKKGAFLQRFTLDVLYKLTVRSVVDYCLPLYYDNLKATEVLKLDRIQYNAARLVTGALYNKISDKFNKDLGFHNKT